MLWRVCFLLLAWVGTVWGLTSSKCSLEEKGYCDFSEGGEMSCLFSDTADDDISIPFLDVVGQPLTKRVENRGCRIPRTGDGPFTVKVEPCYHNGTAPVNMDEKTCPDPPPAYYEKHLINLHGIPDTTTHNKNPSGTSRSLVASPHIFSGTPLEIKILSIGSKFFLTSTGENDASTLITGDKLSKFRFRTMPYTKAEYDYTLKKIGLVYNHSSALNSDTNVRKKYDPSNFKEHFGKVKFYDKNRDENMELFVPNPHVSQI